MTNFAVVNHTIHEGADGIEIPPYPRKPEDGSREATDWMIGRIDHKVKQLKGLGLRPHPTMLEYREELLNQVTRNESNKVRTTSKRS